MAANQNLVEQITLSVESTKDVQFSADEAQIINAVSPKVNIRRMEDGAVITVTDVDGVHDPVTIYDGAKGEKGDAGGVQYDSAQTLNATQKQTARTNISAASEDEVTDLKSAFNNFTIEERKTNGIRNITDFVHGGPTNGYIFPLKLSDVTNRVRTKGFLYVNHGDTVVINPGSYKFAVWLWSGTPDSGAVIMNRNWATTQLTLPIPTTADFMMVVYADKTDATAEIDLTAFDGTITITPYEQKQFSDRKIYVDNTIEAIIDFDGGEFFGWKQGAAYKQTGGTALVTNDLLTRCRFVQTIKNPYIKTIIAKSGYQFAVCICTLNNNVYTVVENWNGAWKTELDVSAYAKDYYIAISVAKIDTTANILPSEASTNILYVSTLNDKIDASINDKIGSSPIGIYSPLLRPAKPRIVAHRGLMGRAPENTVPSFTLAGQQGAWAIETDIWESADGYFICNHNNDVSGMTDGTGNITNMTYEQIMACTVDSGVMIPSYPDLKLATLDQYLTICRRYGCVAIVEIKGITHYDNFVAKIRQYGMEGSTVFLTTWTPSIINSLRGLCNTPIMVSATDGNYENLIANASTKPDIWVSLNKDYVTTDYIISAHNLNIPAGSWAYLNVADMTSAIEMGLDFILANNFASID